MHPCPIYLGIPPSEAERLRLREPPAYLLTIENFTSFNRHIIETDATALGATIYVGGYPHSPRSKRCARSWAMLATTVPIFHWSDIDPDGTWIFRTIEQAVGRTLRPHLMSPDIAERLGKVPQGKSVLRPCARESGIFPLAEYLARDGARTWSRRSSTRNGGSDAAVADPGTCYAGKLWPPSPRVHRWQ